MHSEKIFKKGSTTYYYASVFFPRELREKVFTLYAYVRTADNFVDTIPQDITGFQAFRERTMQGLEGVPIGDSIVQEFCALAKEHAFDQEWIVAFLDAMEADTHKKQYSTFAELENYMFGSAEVIGLMMARLMGLPKEAYTTARLQGKAMQLINFIRDIREDLDLGRTYIPAEDMKRFGVSQLPPANDLEKEAFAKLIHFEIDRYTKLQKKADAGYRFLPRRYRISISTAAEMYSWTAAYISRNPMIVFDRKIKPRPTRVILTALKNSIAL